MSALQKNPRKPAIYVSEAEHERLWNLAHASETEGAALLARELDRAIVLQEGEGPGAFVRLGSLVEYRDLTNGRVRQVRLATPDEADIDQGRLSVVTPVGAALIGLRAGDAFSWTADDGRARDLVIVRVADAVAPAG